LFVVTAMLLLSDIWRFSMGERCLGLLVAQRGASEWDGNEGD